MRPGPAPGPDGSGADSRFRGRRCTEHRHRIGPLGHPHVADAGDVEQLGEQRRPGDAADQQHRGRVAPRHGQHLPDDVDEHGERRDQRVPQDRGVERRRVHRETVTGRSVDGAGSERGGGHRRHSRQQRERLAHATCVGEAHGDQRPGRHRARQQPRGDDVQSCAADPHPAQRRDAPGADERDLGAAVAHVDHHGISHVGGGRLCRLHEPHGSCDGQRNLDIGRAPSRRMHQQELIQGHLEQSGEDVRHGGSACRKLRDDVRPGIVDRHPHP
ncbi:MAG: hypothetical protein K0R87_2088, partial [Pseudonocardia sp.]|nr:hypothetical protein [Pseudonocardia sp.]